MMLAMIAAKLPLLLQVVPASPDQMTVEQFNRQIALEAVRNGRGPGGAGILVPIALFAMILVIVWLGTRRRQAEIRARAEFQKQLLDKFGSGRELSEFLETKESQRFLNELWSQGAGRTNRVLRALQNGIVLTMLGLGFLALSHMRRGFVIPGVLVLSLGVGFLLSAVIAHQLSKKLGGSSDAGPDDASLSRT
jgi:hypothetical protein